MMSEENSCQLHIVFNILEKLPRTGAPMLHSFHDGYWQSVREFQQQEQFLEGMLLKKVQSGGKARIFFIPLEVAVNECTGRGRGVDYNGPRTYCITIKIPIGIHRGIGVPCRKPF